MYVRIYTEQVQLDICVQLGPSNATDDKEGRFHSGICNLSNLSDFTRTIELFLWFYNIGTYC